MKLSLQRRSNPEEKRLGNYALATFDYGEDPSLLIARPPVISILGHFDHGKPHVGCYSHTEVAVVKQAALPNI
jgi:hypothetical protein